MKLRKLLYMFSLLTIYAIGFGGMGMMGMNQCFAAAPASTQAPRPELTMVDGPGMANVNAWKHDVLNGGWITPVGDLAMEISGFDYKFGIYKKGEPDNFRWYEGRFYFAGWQKSPIRSERFDLCFTEEPCIKDAEENVLITLVEMWHENKSIYMKVKYPNSKEIVVKELRQAKDIVE